MKRLFLFLLTAVGLYAQNQNVTVQPSPGSGGMNTGTFNTYGINYYLAKPATTWDFTQATVLLPQSISGVLSINAGPGIGVNNNTGQVTVSNLGVITLTAGNGLVGTSTAGNITLNNVGVLGVLSGNGIAITGNGSYPIINSVSTTNGTVTNVSAIGQNGIGAVTTNSSTTPVITLNLGAITPSSVTTNALTVGSLTGPVISIAGTYGVTSQSGTGIPAYNNAPSITNATLLGTTNVANISTTGLLTTTNIRTTGLTGYLYGNDSTGNVSASTTIPAGSVTGLATVATTGNYYDLTNRPTLNAGTVTSVSGTGSVNGVTLTGTVTTSGSLTLGGTLSGISNSQLTNNSITITAGAGLSGGGNVALGGTTTLSNAGVTSLSGTNGVTTNSSTGSVQVGLGAITPTSVSTGALTATGTTTLATGLNGYLQASSGVVSASSTIPTSALSGTIALGTQVSGTLNAASGGTGVAGTITGYEYANGTGAHTASTTIPTSVLSGTISNSQLTNNSITIAGTATALGGSISQDTITGLSTTGLVQRTGANTLAIATPNTNYLPATTGNSAQLLASNGSGGMANVNVGSGLSYSGGTLSSTSGGGSVTNVTVSGNSGVLAGVATPTTTPSISIGLGNITPLSDTSVFNGPIGGTTPNAGSFTTLNASGVVNVSNTTASTTTTTGSIVTAGGLGVSGKINTNGLTSFAPISISQTTTVPNYSSCFSMADTNDTLSFFMSLGATGYNSIVNSGDTGMLSILNTTDNGLVIGKHNGAAIRFSNAATNTIQFSVNSIGEVAKFSSSGNLSIGTTTASSSTSTGALVVGNGTSGGLGVGGAINAGGNITSGGYVQANGGLMYLYGTGTSLSTRISFIPASGYGSFFDNFTNGSGFAWRTSQTSGLDTNAMTLGASGGVNLNTYAVDGFRVNQQTAGGYCVVNCAYNNSGTYYYDYFTNANETTVYGSITSNGSTTTYATTSDKRLKTSLRSWSLGDKFDQIPIGEFTWKESGVIGHGTLAQDLYQIYPDAVVKGDDGAMPDPKKTGSTWSVDYGKLTVPLIAEVKSLRSRVKTLEQDQATVLEAINQLKAEFNQYKKDHP